MEEEFEDDEEEWAEIKDGLGAPWRVGGYWR